MWDHDWSSNNHITIQHYFWLTPSNYDWKLRVYDAWSGDHGKITDFYLLIGFETVFDLSNIQIHQVTLRYIIIIQDKGSI